MSLHPETHSIQSQFATYVRNGEKTEIDGARTERLPHYRRLIFNVFEDTLSSAYPITRQISSDDEWQFMVDDFMQNHNAQSAQIWKLPFEFYEFAVEQNYAEKLNRPYLNELLYFEWLEIEVHTMPDADIPDLREKGDVLNEKLFLNPEHRVIHLTYPVHKLEADKLEKNKGNYFVLIYRDLENGRVQFFEMSLIFAVILDQLSREAKTGLQALEEATQMMEIEIDNEIIQQVIPFFNDLLLQKIILGFI